jgi:hypothetical protein
MNFFDARISGHGPDRAAEIVGLGRQPVNGAARSHGDGDRVLVAIRPEGFTPFLAPPEGSAIAGRLVARQYLGGRQVLQVAIAGRASPVAVATLAQRGADAWEGREDQPIWLGFRPDALTVLDPD